MHYNLDCQRDAVVDNFGQGVFRVHKKSSSSAPRFENNHWKSILVCLLSNATAPEGSYGIEKQSTGISRAYFRREHAPPVREAMARGLFGVATERTNHRAS